MRPLTMALVIVWAMARLTTGVRADTPPLAPTVVLLVDGLTLDTLSDRAYPHVAAFASRGAVGLMNTAVAGHRTDTAAVLPLALGALAPAEPTDTLAFAGSEAIELSTAAIVYARRMGRSLPPGSPGLVHLGWASLRRRGYAGELVGAVLARNGLLGAIHVARLAGADTTRRVALFAVGPDGTASAALFTADTAGALARWITAQSRLAIVDLGPGGAQALDALLAVLSGYDGRLLVLSPRPPLEAWERWTPRLTPVIFSASSLTPGLLRSATTRTTGLVANVDLAPTLLAALNVPPPASMVGHPIVVSPSRAPLRELTRLDRLVTLNERALVPVFALLGAVAVGTVFGGFLALRRAPSAAPSFGFVMLCLMTMPLALLLAAGAFAAGLYRAGAIIPAVAPGSPLIGAYAATIVALMALCGALSAAAGRRQTQRCATDGPAHMALFTLAVVMIDGVTGQNLVRFALLSSYQLQGIRFYGIGNEYMGVLIGVTLLWVFLRRWSAGAAGALFLLVTLVLGSPGLGAKAGGMVTAGAAFGTAWSVLRRGRVTLWQAALWTIAGFALAFAMAGFERLLPGTERSHLGASLNSTGSLAYGYLLEIMARKAAMNGRILVHPITLTAITALGVILTVAASAFRERAAHLIARHGEWARAWPAVGYGTLAALVFNDSGTVAALFLLGSFATTGIYLLLVTPPGTAYTDMAREAGSDPDMP